MAESSPRLAGLLVSVLLANVSSSGPDAAAPKNSAGALLRQQRHQGVQPLPFLPLLIPNPREAARADGTVVGNRLTGLSSLRAAAALRGGAKNPASGKRSPARARARKGKRRGGESGNDDSEGGWSWERYNAVVGVCCSFSALCLQIPPCVRRGPSPPRWLPSGSCFPKLCGVIERVRV